MRRPILFLITAFLLSLGVFAHADDLVQIRLGDYLEALRVQAGIPGLAAVLIGPSDVQWQRGFGNQDVEHGAPARPDTPFHVDGLTQVVTAALLLRCDWYGRISLNDRVGTYAPTSPEAGATVRQVLSHASNGPGGLTFTYRLERLDALAPVVSACTDSSFRLGMAGLLDQMIMFESVPGPDAVVPPAANDFPASTVDRYRGLMQRLALPYSIDAQLRPSPSQYAERTLTPASGLISSALDFAHFDLALKRGALVGNEALANAWTPPIGANGQRLPHGLGWFVQTYNGEPIVWQFGAGDAASALYIMAPRRGQTLILVANSSGLSKSFPLAAGDVTVSPFARVFLGIFVR